MGKIRSSVGAGIVLIVVAITVFCFSPKSIHIHRISSRIIQVEFSRRGQDVSPNQRATVAASNTNTTTKATSAKLIKKGTRQPSTATRLAKKPWRGTHGTRHPKKPSTSAQPADARLRKRPINLSSPAPFSLTMNSTHVGDRVMEPVDVDYAENIFFSVKTMSRYHNIRLPLLMLTWLQAVKDKTLIVTDGPQNKNYASLIQNAGFNIIVTDCPLLRGIKGICCKMGAAFAGYYEVVEQHKDDKDSYQWFCHFDDDVYVNVPQLSKLLQQYDPHQPYYLGKYPQITRRYNMPIRVAALNNLMKRNLIAKLDHYRYATGAAYCISQALMMKAKPYLNGKDTYYNTCAITSLPNSDDVPLGFVIDFQMLKFWSRHEWYNYACVNKANSHVLLVTILQKPLNLNSRNIDGFYQGALLGYNLTIIDTMCSQYDDYVSATKQQLLNYATVSYLRSQDQSTYDHTVPLTPQFKDDPTRFMTYHCLLYPKVSWCHTEKQRGSSVRKWN